MLSIKSPFRKPWVCLFTISTLLRRLLSPYLYRQITLIAKPHWPADSQTQAWSMTSAIEFWNTVCVYDKSRSSYLSQQVLGLRYEEMTLGLSLHVRRYVKKTDLDQNTAHTDKTMNIFVVMVCIHRVIRLSLR